MAYQCINYLKRVGDNAEKVFLQPRGSRCTGTRRLTATAPVQ